jgi:hypothetical protein
MRRRQSRESRGKNALHSPVLTSFIAAQPFSHFSLCVSAKEPGGSFDGTLSSSQSKSRWGENSGQPAGTVCQRFDFSAPNHLSRRYTSKQLDACRPCVMFFTFCSISHIYIQKDTSKFLLCPLWWMKYTQVFVTNTDSASLLIYEEYLGIDFLLRPMGFPMKRSEIIKNTVLYIFLCYSDACKSYILWDGTKCCWI